ncbi:MAG: hypothetical protein LBP62_05655 [Clostridiales bacterium]|jgi:hypothetical protein|nr:hypothetical protein [Clostridiales bacterium]
MKPIKVKELIGILKKENPDALVGLSSDSEGNSFSLMTSEDCLGTEIRMKNELGSQETLFLESDVKATVKSGDTEIQDWRGNKVKIFDLAPVVILYGSN